MRPAQAVRALQQRLGLHFSDPSLLETALTHRSYLNENPEHNSADNERLEFLGDAVLGLIVGAHLYRSLPEGREGDLTAMRAAVVNAEALSRFAREIGLGPLLLLSRGEATSGGRERAALLSAAFEAVVGAIYLDQGFQAAGDFVGRFVGPELERLRRGALEKDAKSYLQELAQARWQVTPSYRTVEERGPDHAREFTVEVVIGSSVRGRGRGRSKQAAEQEAAREALQTWVEAEEGQASPL